jgi:acylglycerol lipase
VSPVPYSVRLEAWIREVGAAASDVRYARPPAGGDTAALRLAPAVAARGRAVVAHGAGNDATYLLLDLFAALLRAGIEVFTFDLDGHGTASTTVFDPRAVRGCVAAAVEAAEAGGPGLPLHLVGHSLGGALVLDALASRHSPRAVSVAVLSAPLRIGIGPRAVWGELRGFLRPATLSQRRHHGVWGLVPAFGPVRRRAFPFRRTGGGRGPFGYVDLVHDLLREMRLEERAARVAPPALLVYGTADHLAGHQDGERLAAVLPVCELLSLPGVGHYGIAFDPPAVRRTAEWVVEHGSAGG